MRSGGCPARRTENSYKTGILLTEKHPTSIANGWSEPVLGRELHPAEVQSLFCGALFRQLHNGDFPMAAFPKV